MKRSRRPKCQIGEKSETTATVESALNQLLDAGTQLEKLENLKVLLACMDYVSQQSQWPTAAEITAISGLDINRVLEVEARLGGTYEFALRNGLVKNSN
jgi:hypothetical protein